MRRTQRSDPEPKQADDRSYLMRPARLEDIRAISQLESIVFRSDAYSEETLYDLMRQRCLRCTSLNTVAEAANKTPNRQSPSNCSAIYVADSSGSIIGYSIAQIRIWSEFLSNYGIDPDGVLHLKIKGSSPVGYLKSIAVHPDRRREGIGKRFHTIRDAFLRDHNVKYVFLLQMPNPGLVQFHQSLDFQEIPASPSVEYVTGGRARLWYRAML